MRYLVLTTRVRERELRCGGGGRGGGTVTRRLPRINVPLHFTKKKRTKLNLFIIFYILKFYIFQKKYDTSYEATPNLWVKSWLFYWLEALKNTFK